MEYDEYKYSNYSYTDSWEEDDYHYPPLIRTVLMSLTTAIALLANVLLLVVLCSAPSLLNTTSNVIFLQRAIADLFSSIAMVFFTVGTTGVDIIVTGTCITFSVIIHVGTVASIEFLMAFAMDSYLAAYPQHHPPPSRRKTLRMTSALAWVLAAAAGIAAIVFTEASGRMCFLGPFFQSWNVYIKALELVVMLVVPLTVTWVFVSMALLPLPNSSSAEAREPGEKGPNRSLMLGLTSTFTVAYCLYWIFEIVIFSGYYGSWLLNLYYIIVTLPTLSEAVNPILVICLTEDLRQKVAGWLPSRRHSTSLPLGEL
uniref:G-protein coupled receptors family 1 profile domain-containing protein n=1 Tax=Scylla olivacea TaxID=85551 RepID=A0A0N7ZC28_SCYOL